MNKGWSTIEIGGKIATSLVKSLCANIRDAQCRVVGAGVTYSPLDVDSLLLSISKDAGTLQLVCDDRYGFDPLEGFLTSYHIPYVVTQHGGSDGDENMQAAFRPDLVSRVWHRLDGNNEPLPDVSAVDDLFTLRRIICNGCYASDGEDLLRRLLMKLLADADPDTPPLPTLEFCDD